MTKAAFLELLDRYIQGTCTPEEQHLFNLFVKKMGEGQFHWKLNEKERIKLEIYQNIRQQIEIPTAARNSKVIRLPIWKQIAASVAIILMIGTYFLTKNSQPDYITITTDYDELDTIQLPDGSQVFLNEASSLIFPKEFKASKREVTLMGEAFFEVKRNPQHPFEVTTGEARTTVLGTSFNIQAMPGKNIFVTVATGKVKVNIPNSNNQAMVILEANQQAVYYPQSGQLEHHLEVETDAIIAWKHDFIQFDQTPLSHVATVLSNRYKVEILINSEKLQQCLISGKYPVGNLRNVLESIKFIKGIEYQFETPQRIVLSGKPCNE